jgi:hypothetical protein
MRTATLRLAFLSTLCLCATSAPLRANITPVASGHVQTGTVLPTTSTDVRVLSERLTVDIAPGEKQRHTTPVVSIIAEYAMRHDGKEPVNLEIAFPLAGAFEDFSAFYGTPRPTEGLGYEVKLDGSALSARDEALPLPRTARSATGAWSIGSRAPDEAEQRRLTEALTNWVTADATLAELLKEYSRIAPSWEKYSRMLAAFDAEAQALLTRKYLSTNIREYLRNDRSGDVRELVAEADAGLRKSVGSGSTNYVSAVPSYPSPSAEQTEAYRKKIDAWLATRPAIAERYAELAREFDIQRDARKFMAEKVAAQIKGKPGLSELAVARLLRYMEDAYNPNPRGYSEKTGWTPPAKSLPSFAPDEWLVAQVDPQVEKERVRRIAEADALLERYGFDATFISPLTGLGYSQRVGWRDDSTWQTLGFTAPPTIDEQSYLGRHSFERDTYRTVVDSPRSEAKLIRFAVPFQPGQSRTLRVSYKALAEVDQLERGRGYVSQMIHVRYILKTARNWKSFGPIDLTVTMPSGGLVVMEPAPDGAKLLDNNRVQFTAKVENPQSNLRIAWAPVAGQNAPPGEPRRSRLFEMVFQDDLPDLRKLLDAAKHPQARRALTALVAIANRPADRERLTAPYSILRELNELMRAGFTVDEASRFGADGREMYAHVHELARIGWGRVGDFMRPENTFANPPRDPISRWQPEDRRIAAQWAAVIQEEPNTPAAQLARCYIAMLAADRPTEFQARLFMDAARAGDDQQLTIALLLINEYPGDPRPLRPLVDEAAKRTRPTGKTNQTANHLYAATVNASNKIDRYEPPAPPIVSDAARRAREFMAGATRSVAPTSRPAAAD